MRRKVLSHVGVIVAVLLPTGAVAQVQSVASLPYLTLKVTLTHTVSGIPRLVEEFSTSDEQHHNVFCISGFRDVQYVLRDQAGAIVPAIKEPWKRGTDMQYFGDVTTGPHGSDPCKTLKDDKAYRIVLLSDLYSKLSPGTYSLQITLAPRGTTDRANLPPMTVKI